ncbi:MAG: hypothetical protein QOH37_417, partial [Nocardioidaceae bacterium]|nr:hypothetical protein [Nocardioidaceae bacterium]
MNLDEHYRTVLEQLTEEPVGGPDLATSLAAGRRRRRVRRTFVAGGAVAALAVAGTGGAWLQRPHEIVTPDSFAAAPPYHDFVAGTQIDEGFQATIDDDLPGLPDATKVYPSDWNRDTPLPDAQFENATDWEAYYTLNPQVDLVVLMAKDVPGYPLSPKCSEIAVSQGQPTCSVTGLADGARVASYGFTVDVPHGYWFLSVYTAADGSTVTVSQRVGADSWAQAESRRVFTDDEASSLASDAALTFPDPAVTPR